jgi:hypothetical protein
VTPEQISAVTASWFAANRDALLFELLLTAGLPGRWVERKARARWIVRATDRLVPVLDRPATFATGVAELVAERPTVTLADLGAEREAVLGALDICASGLYVETLCAWSCAFDLFEEVVIEHCLDPFGRRPSMHAFGS